MSLRVLFSLLLIAVIGACSDEADRVPYTGVQAFNSGGDKREYYMLLPSDYDPEIEVQALTIEDPRKPLLIAYHGTNGSYEQWLDQSVNGKDLVEVVGDGAIMIFPNALPQGSGTQWNLNKDFDFFLDLLADLDKLGLVYDPDRIFVTGHSSGGGMAHEIGCRFGDIVRGIAPSAGTLVSNQCVGGVGVLMSQGVNDALVSFGIAEGAYNFWLAYNGLDEGESIEGAIDPCIDHSLLPPGSFDYPVVWCRHEEGSLDDFSGHRWGSFTSEAVWQFFSTLSDLSPGPDEPPGGGNEAVFVESDTTVTFTVKFPDDFETPVSGALTMYEGDFINCPGFAIPSSFLNLEWLPAGAQPGSTVTYENVPIRYVKGVAQKPLPDELFPADWSFQVSVYVEGGGSFNPTPGLDMKKLISVYIPDKVTPLVIEETIELEIFDGVYYKYEGEECVPFEL